MAIRLILALTLSLLLSVNVYAASADGGNPAAATSEQQSSALENLYSWIHNIYREFRENQAERQLARQQIARADGPAAVPELDGSMGFLGLGLAFAVVGLFREQRRRH